MRERIRQLVQYATRGNEARFAESVGWSRQYLCNVLSGRRDIGLTPVRKVLRAYPDISARWLILGEGAMLHSASDIIRECLYEVTLAERDTASARDLTRTTRALERLTARLRRGGNGAETAP